MKQQGQQTISPVKQLRIQFGIKQSDLALMLRCSQSYLSRLENGYLTTDGIKERLTELNLDAARIARLQEQFVEFKRRSLVKDFHNRE